MDWRDELPIVKWDDADSIQVGNEIEAESPKAVLLNVRNRQVWIPKSQLRISRSELYGDSFSIPSWLAARNRLRY